MRDYLIQRRQLEGVLAPKLESAIEQLLLKGAGLVGQALSDARHRNAHTLSRKAVDHFDLAGVRVTGADVETNRHPLELPMRVLVARPSIAPVDSMSNAGRLQRRGPGSDECLHLGATFSV